MSRRLLVLGLVACLAACHPRPDESHGATPAADAATDADARFAAISAQWLDESMRIGPVGATQAGDHRFDGDIDDLSAGGRGRAEAFSRRLLERLDRIDAKQLSRANQVDAAMLRNQLRLDLWNAQTFRSWAWDPLVYTQLAGNSLYLLTMREFAPLPDRLRSATARMEKLPQLFAQARENLDPARVPKIHAETAAKQNGGVLTIVDEAIVPNAGALAGDDRKRLDAAIANLRTAVAEHQRWLDRTLVPGARGDYRVGAQRFDEKLAFTLYSSLPRAEIRRRAEAEADRMRAQMYALSRKILAGKPGAPPYPANPTPEQLRRGIAAALELAYAERPARDRVIATAEATLAGTTAFVREKDLVTVPDAPLKVVPMPLFQAGIALASCEPPGPLDKGLDTFYTVSPIPPDWTQAQVDSFLREYNTRAIDVVTIHEATPGHYLQMWHANRYPSPLRAVLWSSPFVEGWAWYAQTTMIDEGYRRDDLLFQLVSLKFLLRGVGNAILDQAVHVDGISRADAMRMMMEDTFQEESEAAAKWVRAQLSAGQLSTYFVGVEEWYDLRREAERRAGKGFDLKRYHDTILSYGSPPIRLARALYLDEDIH